MKLNFLLFLLISFSANTHAQQHLIFGGSGSHHSEHTDCISTQERIRIEAMLKENIRQLKDEGKLPADWGTPQPGAKPTTDAFIWPLRNANGLNFNANYGISNFVDLNLSYPNQIQDWNCGTRSYDQASGYNHAGVDIFLWPFSHYLQEHDLVEIVAASDGIIIGKDDGNFDKNCAMGNAQWNAVYVGNTDGTICWYGHMKKNSTTTKITGQSVVAGEVLGNVGSSGSSTGPHLHFETHDGLGNILEPFTGPCNPGPSLWAAQKPYIDPTLNAILTHNHAPVFPDCPGVEIPHDTTYFHTGDSLFFASYFHDQTDAQQAVYTIYAPDNSVWDTWNFTSPQPYFNASYFYWYNVIQPDYPSGKYLFKVAYEGDTLMQEFWINEEPEGIRGDGATGKLTRIIPNPNSGNFNLIIDPEYAEKKVNIFVTDIRGVTLDHIKAPEGKQSIPVKSNLTPGIYFLKITASGKQPRVLRFIVK
jgi:hypothetical protein